MKAIVTAWQTARRPRRLNDHTDADYDRGVLARLAELHATSTAWLDAARDRRLPRLATYGERLGRAPSRPRPATASSSRHPAWTATTAPGSSSTRT